MHGRLTMICSGITAGTRRGAFPSDEPAEAKSLALAEAMRATLPHADRVWSAPALRARQTAEALALKASVEPLLADQDFGRWAGRRLEDVQAAESEAVAAWLTNPDAAPHGGESLADVARRASRMVDGLVAERGHTIALTHASVIRTAILHVLGAPLAASLKIDIEPLSITDFRNDGRRWVLRACGVPGPRPAISRQG
ncbi:MAG: histidine phosphatase family protein [Mesorhizobium sp.]|nr:histidine phosphatase family protein [Mesorhizobium sp.]MBN9220197.1 histidine phosphatase family protein [Mesorhizobium sp.]